MRRLRADARGEVDGGMIGWVLLRVLPAVLVLAAAYFTFELFVKPMIP